MTATTAMITPDLEALCNPNITLDETSRAYENAIPTTQNNAADVFERALKVKMALDVFEVNTEDDLESTSRALAYYINGEYQLLKLYQSLPLRSNPFLSHWVEAVQRLSTGRGRGKVDCAERDILTMGGIDMARALWIQTLLSGTVTGIDKKRTPLQLAISLVNNDGERVAFDLRPFIKMLEDEGIYEPGPSADHTEPGTSAVLPTSTMVNHSSPSQTEHDKAPPHSTIEQFKLDLPGLLKYDPNRATFELTRLPIELPSLDYLNTLLSDRVLEAHSVDPAPVVTQYIQHSLRTIEQMERPSSSHDQQPGDFGVHNERDLQYGKEAQSRAVRLLLLFIKSLIRKGLMAADVLYFEIQEICVRYVWIREVREFRTWVEEGIGQEGGG